MALSRFTPRVIKDSEVPNGSFYSIRITTYNIHKCMRLDRRVRPKRIAEVLKQIDADIIALQEVTGMDEASGERNHLHAIAEELGFDFRTRVRIVDLLGAAHKLVYCVGCQDCLVQSE